MFGNNGSNTDSASATILTPSSSEYNSHHQQVPPNQQVPPTLWGQYRGSCFVAQHSTSDHPAETSRKQPTVTDEREPEPGVETWSNAATTGTGPDWDDNAAPMSREMDFRNEFERLRYLMGAGLPAYGFDAEARLLRAINMNHYILVGHVSESLENTTKALYLGLQREIAESHNTLFLELQDIKAKLGSSPPSREAPYIPPQRPQFSARQPTDEQDSEIEQLWAQSRILKEENVTLAKELAERKEVEDLQVTELLYQNKIIENMHAKSREMAKELASCWREIKKLQDTVKVMEGALATKPKKETIALTGGKPKLGSTVTPVPAKLAVEDNLQQLLDKINDGIEKLADTDYSRTANSKKESLPDQANKDGSVQSNTDECECELCERARAKKNIGVGNQPPQFETSIVKGKEPESVVIYNEAQNIETSQQEQERNRPLAGITDFNKWTVLASATVTNVYPESPVLQKWRETYNKMREGNQRVVEAKKPNGDVVIYLLDMASYEAQDGKREDNLSAQKNQNSGNTMNEPSGVTKELRGFNGAPLPSPKIRPFHPIVHAVPLRREAPKFGTYGFPPVMPESEQGQSRSAEVINLDTLRSIDSRLTKINRTLDGININSPLPSLKVDGGKGERQGEGEEKSGNASGAGKSSSYLYLRSPLHDGKSGTADNVSSSSSVVSRTTTPNQSQGQTQRKKVQFTSEQKKYFVREDGTWDFVLVGDNGKEFLDSAAGSDVATKATTEGDEGEGGQSCKAGVEQAPCIRTPSSSTPSSPLEGKGEQKSGNGH